MNDITIVYSLDKGYYYQTIVSVTSLLDCERKEKKEVTFYFLFSGLDKNQINFIKTLTDKGCSKSYFINVDEKLAYLKPLFEKKSNNYSPVIFCRLFLGSLLKKEKRVLYLDGDTLIFNDLSYLFNLDLENKTLGAVFDACPSYFKERKEVDNKTYINSGVILFDLEKYREKNYELQILNLLKYGNQQYRFPDQDIINIIFKNDILILPLKFNYFQWLYKQKYSTIGNFLDLKKEPYYSKKEFDEACLAPTIVHYVYFPTIVRPWFDCHQNKLGKAWKKIANNLKKNGFSYKKLDFKKKIKSFIYHLIFVFGGKKAQFFAFKKELIRKDQNSHDN